MLQRVAPRWLRRACYRGGDRRRPPHKLPRRTAHRTPRPGAPAAAGAAPGRITHPLPATASDLKRYAASGLVFRGLAGAGDRLAATQAGGVVEAGSRFWYTPK